MKIKDCSLEVGVKKVVLGLVVLASCLNAMASIVINDKDQDESYFVCKAAKNKVFVVADARYKEKYGRDINEHETISNEDAANYAEIYDEVSVELEAETLQACSKE